MKHIRKMLLTLLGGVMMLGSILTINAAVENGVVSSYWKSDYTPSEN